MFCTVCGVKNPADSNFCKQCGKALDRTAPIVLDEADYARALPEEEQVDVLLENAYQHRSKGDTTGAIRLCEEAIRLHPESAAAHSLMAQLSVHLGDRDRAIREYERILQLNPSSIADRIKLEELRSGKDRAPVPVVYAAPPASGSANPLAIAAAAFVLIAVGAVMAKQLEGLNKPKTEGVVSKPQEGNAMGVGGTQMAQNQNPTFQNAGGQPQQSQYGQPTGIMNTNPPASNQDAQGNQVVSAPPFYNPIVVASNNNSGSGVNPPRYANLPALRRGGSIQPMPPMQIAGGSFQPAPNPGTRVRLNNNESGDDGKTYDVKIDVGKPNTPSPNRNAATPTDSVSREARTALELANNHIQRNDLNSAIKAYQSALPGAGHQAAQIYQQIAYCYERKGDKVSGKTNYERAISEFKTLATQGIMKESSEDAIRACQRGLKLCE